MDVLVKFKENSDMETIITMYLTSSIALTVFLKNEEESFFK